MRQIYIEESWKTRLTREFEEDYMQSLSQFLREQKLQKKTIYPPGNKIFNAFQLTKFEEVKVVILGQDPYHGIGQAHGLSFSVEQGIKPPPSLKNIFKELEYDLGLKQPEHGNLEKWAHQGVLLLNSILTVERGNPGSHAKKGWEIFTDQVLKTITLHRKNIVFILWGQKAQDKCDFIDANENLVIKSSHPSPYSAHAGFLGSKPFSRANNYLKDRGIDPIDWDLS
jgi:uracil-DNA glycosylase